MVREGGAIRGFAFKTKDDKIIAAKARLAGVLILSL